MVLYIVHTVTTALQRTCCQSKDEQSGECRSPQSQKSRFLENHVEGQQIIISVLEMNSNQVRSINQI